MAAVAADVAVAGENADRNEANDDREAEEEDNQNSLEGASPRSQVDVGVDVVVVMEAEPWLV